MDDATPLYNEIDKTRSYPLAHYPESLCSFRAGRSYCVLCGHSSARGGRTHIIEHILEAHPLLEIKCALCAEQSRIPHFTICRQCKFDIEEKGGSMAKYRSFQDEAGSEHRMESPLAVPPKAVSPPPAKRKRGRPRRVEQVPAAESEVKAAERPPLPPNLVSEALARSEAVAEAKAEGLNIKIKESETTMDEKPKPKPKVTAGYNPANEDSRAKKILDELGEILGSNIAPRFKLKCAAMLLAERKVI